MSSPRDWSLLEREIEAINRFPDENPNPVLRMTESGRLTYANDSARPIVAAWRASIGELLPAEVAHALRESATGDPADGVEVTDQGRTFAVLAVRVPDLGVYNLYGTDVTANKVVERFPGESAIESFEAQARDVEEPQPFVLGRPPERTGPVH